MCSGDAHAAACRKRRASNTIAAAELDTAPECSSRARADPSLIGAQVVRTTSLFPSQFAGSRRVRGRRTASCGPRIDVDIVHRGRTDRNLANRIFAGEGPGRSGLALAEGHHHGRTGSSGDRPQKELKQSADQPAQLPPNGCLLVPMLPAVLAGPETSSDQPFQSMVASGVFVAGCVEWIDYIRKAHVVSMAT
ncbi:hypothetical protein ACVWWO_003433 [Bradyrhizobium sp. F1.13.1]